MLIKELLKELLAMLTNNKAVEVGKGQEGRVLALREGEGINKFLKARTVDLYIYCSSTAIVQGLASAKPQF
jgi:hypothetical protein